MNSLKKITAVFAASMLLFACTSNDGNNTTIDSTDTIETDTVMIPDSVTGKPALVMFKENEVRATGNEPFWMLELKADSVNFKLMSGFEFNEPLPAPVINTKDSLQYNFQTGAASVTVLFRNEECTNGMSGFKSPFTVSMKFTGTDNTQHYNGCGDYLSNFKKVREQETP